MGGVAFALAAVLAAVFPDVTIYGIVVDEPIDSVVRARADRARKLARLDPLGLRYWLPESLNAPLRCVLRRAAQPEVGRSDSGVDRVRHDVESSETGLDLFAFVRP